MTYKSSSKLTLEKFQSFFFRRMGCVNGKSVLTESDLDFIARNTALDRGEVEDHHKAFVEKHPDGKISRKEFGNMMRQCYPDADTDKIEKHIFRMYDSNSDGSIDFREFMVVLYVMSSGSPEQNLAQIFRVFDINNDGAISTKELRRIVKDLFHLFGKCAQADASTPSDPETLADEAFKEMDVNSDGKISQEEFVAACMKQERISSMLALKIIDVFVAE